MKLLIFVFLFTLGACASSHATNKQLITVASLNLKISGDNHIIEHTQHLGKVMAEARKKGADYLLLPELVVLDMFPGNPKDENIPMLLDAAAKYSDSFVKRVADYAKENSINVIGASFIVTEKNSYKNRALFISNKGKVHFQDKIQPTPWEKKHSFVGGKEITLYKTDDFNFVILTCHDAEFPGISLKISKMNPEVIFVPSQTDDVEGMNRVRITSHARAIENMSYVVMTGASSKKDAPWHSYVGRNYLFTPENRYFPHKEETLSSLDEELTLYKIDLAKLREARKDIKQVYPARDQI
ncbi:MAG: hypothetical protein K2P81_03880 [Bacteriovoracaceae bacterium]|nr:hypothetical protein [Bacteriovoracaceae bacterium]